jgi:uncharacterized metal-binding protein YceD (DUF177 family)
MFGREAELETQARLTVDVTRLDEEGEWFRGETAPGVLDVGESDILTPVGGIVFNLFVQVLGTELLVRGEVWQRLTCVCSRCAALFEAEAGEKDFIRSFEINDATEFLDLTEEVREAIILALPGYPVCREACQGLCLACGANLNAAVCTCRKTGRDGRWAALDALK